MCVREGRAYFFEVKNETGVVSDLQRATLRKWLHTKATCAVVRSLADVKCYLS